MFVVPLLASVYGARPSTGLLLPMLIMADVFAVRYYNKHAQWKHIYRLAPWAIFGILIALILGKYISANTFKTILSVVVIGGLLIMVYQDLFNKEKKVPNSRWFSAITGILGGFTTMIGNAAGPVMSLYLLSMRLPKNEFIGTGAWFFLLINVFKVPLHIFYWKTISVESITFNLILMPVIILGVFIGIEIVKHFNQVAYRYFIIGSTLVAAFALFIK